MNRETEQRQQTYRFFKIGLIVTGKGEQEFMPRFLRTLTKSSHCTFKVLRKIGQRSPITSSKKKQKMVGTGKTIPDKDTSEIGFEARKWLSRDRNHLLLLIDDLEADRRPIKQSVFDRYRNAIDQLLRSQSERERASVHFLVNMIEAYYFADTEAVNAVLDTHLADHSDDVEEIPHPKNDLKKCRPGFDEVRHGEKIIEKLDLEHVLDNPKTCGSLRVLFAWCLQSMGITDTRFRLDDGVYADVTDSQLGRCVGL